MKVFSLVGPSGCGKSTIIDRIKKNGICTMSEDYLMSDTLGFKNTELLSKWNWIAKWISKLLEYRDITELLITDRCPIEVVPYATNGSLFFEVIKETLSELREHNISIKYIYLHVSFETCLSRVKARMRNEPIRAKYGETNYEYTKNIYDFYERGVNNLWNYTIDSDTKSIDKLMEEIISLTK